MPRPLAAAVLAFLAIAALNTVVAIQRDIACDLDCAPDEDVTLADAASKGTGISPPLAPPALILVGLVLASRRGWPGVVGPALIALASLVMLVAWVLDGATARVLSPFQPLAGTLTILLAASILALGAAAVRAILTTRRARAAD